MLRALHPDLQAAGRERHWARHKLLKVPIHPQRYSSSNKATHPTLSQVLHCLRTRHSNMSLLEPFSFKPPHSVLHIAFQDISKLWSWKTFTLLYQIDVCYCLKLVCVWLERWCNGKSTCCPCFWFPAPTWCSTRSCDSLRASWDLHMCVHIQIYV